MIEHVIVAAVTQALDTLPSQALGLRSHALPTESDLDRCISALATVIEERRLSGVHVVIGSSARPAIPAQGPITVLPCDAAAAYATYIRNNIRPPSDGPLLLYFNSDSTPGEAGLDSLTEMTAAHIAAAFAQRQDLPLLYSLASSTSRRVRAKILDASIHDLARYAQLAKQHSEGFSAPVLGFLFGLTPKPAAAPSAAQAFDSLLGPRAAENLKRALTTLNTLPREAKDRAEVALVSRHPELVTRPGGLALTALTQLCAAAERHARGQDATPYALCGLSADLARALRRGEEGVRALLAPTSEGTPHVVPLDELPLTDHVMSDSDVLQRLGGNQLSGTVRIDDEDQETNVSLVVQDEDLSLRPRGRVSLVKAVLKKVGLEFLRKGGCLAIKVETTNTASPAFDVSRLNDVSKTADAIAQCPPELAPALDAFLTARGALLDVTSRIGVSNTDVESPEEQASLERAIWLVEHFPLLVVAQCPEGIDAYLAAYESLLRQVFGGGSQQPYPVLVWLTNLDLIFAFSGTRVQRAWLLPLHPLRLAHANLWLQHRLEPPALPTSLAVHYFQSEYLMPEGRDYAYAASSIAVPGDAGLALAAREGLKSLWSLLRDRQLVSAFDIELIDIASPLFVVDALCEEATALLERDAAIPGVHLTIRVAHSDPQHEVIVTTPASAELSLAGQEALMAIRGEGVSLAIVPSSRRAGTSECHLAIQAVDAPFVRLPDLAAAVTLNGGELLYRPGYSGNIALVEISGYGTLESYQDLLRSLGLPSDARGLDPAAGAPEVGTALVKALVARRGWPLRPNSASNLLTHAEVEDHVVVTLVDPEVFDSVIAPRLREVSRAGGDLDATRLRAGVLAMNACQDFLRNVAERRQNIGNLRGNLGLLRAFDAARSESGGTPTLVLSLDGSEGQRWIRSMADAVGGDETRADLLLIEADAGRNHISRLRVAELKAGASRGSLSEAKLADLAHQAQLTASRLSHCFEPGESPEKRVARAALRRLVWLGSGAQLEALNWRAVLTEFDEAIRRGVPPTIVTECWIVPETPWPGEPRFDRTVPKLSPAGQVVPGTENVRFRILEAPPLAQPEPAHTIEEGEPTSVRVAPSPAAPLLSDSAPSSPQSIPPAPRPSVRDTVKPPSPTPVASIPAKTRCTADLPEDAGSSARVLPLQAPDGIRVVLGSLSSGEPALWLPNRTDLVNHFNVGITGTMGTGKTQLTKALVAQILLGGPNNVDAARPGVLIFDYKGDYRDGARETFATTVGAQVLEPQGLPLNPLHAARPKTRQEFALMAQVFADTLRAIDARIGTVQRGEIIRGLKECYHNSGISESDATTWTRPFPTLRDLFQHLEVHDLASGVPQSIIHDLVDLGVFAEEDPATDLDTFFDATHVVNLKPLGGSPTVIRSILCFFMNAFYDRMLHLGEAALELRSGHSLRRLRRIMLVDEADDFIGLNLISLKNVMQQGRSFGHGVILSTQFLHHFNKTDTPLRPLIGTWLLHQMMDLSPTDVKLLFNLSSREDINRLVNRLGTLRQHTSLCYGLSNDRLKTQLVEIKDLPFMQLVASEPARP